MRKFEECNDGVGDGEEGGMIHVPKRDYSYNKDWREEG